jgi:hypothetical protein
LDERIEKISFVKRFSVRRLTRSTPMHHASTTTGGAGEGVVTTSGSRIVRLEAMRAVRHSMNDARSRAGVNAFVAPYALPADSFRRRSIARRTGERRTFGESGNRRTSVRLGIDSAAAVDETFSLTVTDARQPSHPRKLLRPGRLCTWGPPSTRWRDQAYR